MDMREWREKNKCCCWWKRKHFLRLQVYMQDEEISSFSEKRWWANRRIVVLWERCWFKNWACVFGIVLKTIITQSSCLFPSFNPQINIQNPAVCQAKVPFRDPSCLAQHFLLNALSSLECVSFFFSKCYCLPKWGKKPMLVEHLSFLSKC